MNDEVESDGGKEAENRGWASHYLLHLFPYVCVQSVNVAAEVVAHQRPIVIVRQLGFVRGEYAVQHVGRVVAQFDLVGTRVRVRAMMVMARVKG